DAVIERDLDVLGGRDALDRQRNVEAFLEALDRAPVERGLELAARRPPAPGYDMALGDVALAPAVDRGVDGEAEGAVAVRDRARRVVVDPGLVAAHIKLEEAQRVRGGLRDLLEAGLAHRAQHMG